ncbi:hypothetical protein [Rahnella aceris]|jgi:hypothetical protein|uniref:hypothetical protein n=1 Tax=Rahnella sp. (strain Y9602) TaxID=2703885 RepID=UPI001C254C4F|nr:hypothetical protein [Rahnella aceris]MBU9849236.1 hypothetical protein [Rahnella aceris]
MKKNHQQLVIVGLMRDRTPRTCSDNEGSLIEYAGFIPSGHSMSSTINTISKKPQFHIVTGHCAGKKTYSLSEEPKQVVEPTAEKSDIAPVKTLAENSAEFEHKPMGSTSGQGGVMNNYLGQFSEGRLEELLSMAKATSYGNGLFDVQEIIPLLRIAIAAKQAKPDYYVISRPLTDGYNSTFKLDVYLEEVDAIKCKNAHGGVIIPVYTTPPMNHGEKINLSAIPEELGLYLEVRPRFYKKFNVVYRDENKVCGYALHTGRWSCFQTKNFDQNFRIAPKSEAL